MLLHINWQHQTFFFSLPLGAQPLEASGEAASTKIKQQYK